jgi:arylsulfatase A-like enzyme
VFSLTLLSLLPDVSRPRTRRFALAYLAVWGTVAQRQVLPALALRGMAPVLAAAGFAVTIAASWSGIALRLAAADAEALSGLELFFRPVRPPRGAVGRTLWLLALPVVVYGALALTAQMDWGFLLQKVGVLAVWLVTWAAMYAAAHSAKRPSFSIALVASLLLLAAYGGVRLVERRALYGSAWAGQLPLLMDRYAAHDASFRTLDDTLAERPRTSPEFYRFLIANTNIDPAIRIVPTTIDFSSGGPPAGSRRPSIFLFVLDSLRPDYLAPYNPAVTFTPNIAALASDSLVFRNAFTRYGGTGLAVPSIWSGSLLPHRQNLTPFTQTNALARLLRSSDYRFMIGLDVMTSHLLGQTDMTGFDPGRGSTTGDICGTFTQLQQSIDSSQDDQAPVFAYPVPMNVHMSYVQSQPAPVERYPGFHAPTAAQVHRVDACLGSFIVYLKSSGLFDDSIIILTADHGDSLGEEGRWGHNYGGFPEIFRIPIILYLPPDMRTEWSADLTAVSFATDIAPTLYALLGHGIGSRERVLGASLVHPPGALPTERRRNAFLLASSYGPVYAILSQNGRRLYVADTINSRDYAYDLATEPLGTRVSVTAAERAVNEQLIAEQVAEIGAFFGFDAQP